MIYFAKIKVNKITENFVHVLKVSNFAITFFNFCTVLLFLAANGI